MAEHKTLFLKRVEADSSCSLYRLYASTYTVLNHLVEEQFVLSFLSDLGVEDIRTMEVVSFTVPYHEAAAGARLSITGRVVGGGREAGSKSKRVLVLRAEYDSSRCTCNDKHINYNYNSSDVILWSGGDQIALVRVEASEKEY